MIHILVLFIRDPDISRVKDKMLYSVRTELSELFYAEMENWLSSRLKYE